MERRRRCRLREIRNVAVSARPVARRVIEFRFGVRCYGLIRSEKLRRTGMLLPVYGYEKIVMAELGLLGRFHLIPEPLFFQRIHADASASLEFLSEQQEFFAPKSAGRRAFPRLQYLRGYLRAARRFSRSAGERLHCYLWVAAYLAQVRKWRCVMTSTLQSVCESSYELTLLVERVAARPGERNRVRSHEAP